MLRQLPSSSLSPARRGYLLAALYFCVAWCSPALAQNWNFAGPYGAPGRILAVAGDPRSDSVFYLAAPGGGVWKTQDAGINWLPQFDSAPSLQVCSLVLDPRFPDVIYVGTGDDQSPRPLQGVSRSVDGGRNWSSLGRFATRPVCALTVDPANSARILAGSNEGLFLSSDTGATWTKVLYTPVTSVAFDAGGTLYTGMLGDDLPGLRENILTRSTDGGLTWTPLVLPANTNVPGARTNWIGVKAAHGFVYAVVSYQLNSLPPESAHSPQSSPSSLDFYRSADGGETWSPPTAVGQGRPPIAVVPGPDGNLFVAGNSLLASAERGSTWYTIPTPAGQFHAGTVIGQTLLLGGEKGLTPVTLVPGAAGLQFSNLPLGQFLGTGLDSLNAAWAAGPSGLFGPLTLSTDSRVASVGAVGNIGAAGTGSSNIFAAGNSRIHRSTDGGNVFLSAAVIDEAELRAPFPPLVLDPVNTLTAYVGARRIYRTTNSGTSWTSLGVVDPDPSYVVTALAIAPASRGTIYAATACLPEVVTFSCSSASRIWRSANSGTSWVQMAPVTGLVNRLAVDPRQTNTVYAAVGAFPSGPSISAGLAPGDLVRSTNGGALWTSVRGNLPDVPVNAIVIDPTSLPALVPVQPIPGIPGVPIGPGVPGMPGGGVLFNQPAQTLYVGTDAGVFASFNAGGQWIGFSSNLPSSPVTDLVLRQPGGILVAATFGRGVYLARVSGFAAGIVVNRLSTEVTVTQGAVVTSGIALANASTSATNSWRLNALDPWISIPEPNGTLAPGASAQAAFRVSADGLHVGTHLGRLELVSGPYRQNIVVEVHVTASPAQIRIVSAGNLSGAPGTALPPFQVLLTDANELPLPGISVIFAITSAGGTLSAQTAQTNAAGVASTVLTLPPAEGIVQVVATSADLSVTFTATAVPLPALLADSVVDGVTFNAYTPLGPGGVLSIVGDHLSEDVATADELLPLPTALHKTRIVLATPEGYVYLPLLLVSPQWVKAVMPFDAAPGIYTLWVEVASRLSNEIQISIAPFAPGIFTAAGNGRGPGLFIKEDGSIVTAANPADRGSQITFFGSGLGAVTPPVPAGQPGAIGEPLNRTVETPRVFFDSYSAEVIYSGLAPGVGGRYQVTVRVPGLVSPATNISVSLAIGGFSSNRVTIPVR